LTENETRSAEAIILWAGNVNTVPATFWSVFSVLRNPELRKVAMAEVDEVMSDCKARGMSLFNCRLFHVCVLL
jgi:cholesterol 7alpha-monooxygenase